MAVTFSKHSTLVGHQGRCKCESCLLARRRNQKLRSNGITQTVPAAATITRLKAMHVACGSNLPALAAYTNIPRNYLDKLIFQGETKRVDAGIAERVARLPIDGAPVKAYPRREYLWRLHVLHAQGFSLKKLSAMAGVNLRITLDTDRSHNRVTPTKWDALETLYRKIGARVASPEQDDMTLGEIRRTQSAARRRGHHPSAAYENEFDQYPAEITEEEKRDGETADREHLDTLVTRRIKAGLNVVDMIEELGSIYGESAIRSSSGRCRSRLHRERQQRDAA